jgi:hypothetical protein
MPTLTAYQTAYQPVHPPSGVSGRSRTVLTRSARRASGPAVDGMEEVRGSSPLASSFVMSRDTVSRCLETSLHFGWLFGIPASMVAPSSPGSRPEPCGWPAASLDAGCAWGRRSGCRAAGCGWRGLLGWAGWQSARLVVTGRVQGQLTNQVAGVAVDDADVQVVDQKGDGDAGEAGAEADVVNAAVKVSTTCGPNVIRRAFAAMLSREWSSTMFKISTSLPSASRQWVMSACHRSFGCSAQTSSTSTGAVSAAAA